MSAPEAPAGARAESREKISSDALVWKVRDRLVDLATPIDTDQARPVTFEDPEGREVYRHSTAHVMAEAVQDLFPGTKVTIGPPIEDGFYYDFDRDEPFTPEDLVRIEARMREIQEEDRPFVREETSREEARRLFQDRNESYKVEILEEIPDETVSIYRQGEWLDLCRGPHVASTGVIGAVKLLSVAGAYWRGDERNKMLQRIYGTSFPTREALDEYLRLQEEARRRDHRVLGKELGLYLIHEQAGSGLVYWLPRGATLRKVIERFWEDEHVRRGYELVVIPHLAHSRLFRTSGHYDYYRENMFTLEVEGEEYVVKPMNCPGHILIYQHQRRSYRDLPIRFAEMGTVYRNERSGVLHGMLRVRGFTQDDAHIFCTLEQLPGEILGVLDLTLFMLSTFGFEKFDVELSVRDPARPEKYAGKDEEWQAAEAALLKALNQRSLSYKRCEGEAVFYGPKIDVKIVDALGRGWQASTIQFDFNLPRRFDLKYVGGDGELHAPYMIHRALLGSLERFVGALIEHTAGAFPFWLAPVQTKVLPITDRNHPYARGVAARLSQAGVRVEVDERSEKLGYKIRQGRLERIPYLLVVGDREQESETVAVRERSQGDLGAMSLDELLERVRPERTPQTPGENADP
ncbi:MAG: threonine--tRNA ligase [Nitrospinota bacterium]